MLVVVQNGTLSPEEQAYYVRRVTEKFPRGVVEKVVLDVGEDRLIGMWTSATPSTASGTCAKWAGTASATRRTGTPPSRPSCGTRSPTGWTREGQPFSKHVIGGAAK